MLEGYEELDGSNPAQVRVFASPETNRFLEDCDRNSRQHVTKILRILGWLRDRGRNQLQNTEQFRFEGRYRYGGRDIAVFAVKAYQLRVYGGFVDFDNGQAFVCIDGIKKKKNKPNPNVLKRVAKKLGEINDGDQ